MWESEGEVWVCASSPDTGLPMEATLITDVWKDTGILPPLPEAGLPIGDKVLTVREGKLSPLAIKRPRPVLDKLGSIEKIDETREDIRVQVQRAFERNVRVLGCIHETELEKEGEPESLLRTIKTICLNVPNGDFASALEKFLQKRNVGSVAEWRDRMYLWDQVKDISVDVRMATPFQRGNLCEDPQRCEAIEQKGGDPSEIICPQCPVYTVGQERGYLSQFSTLQTTNVQIIEDVRLLLDPQYARIVEQLLERRDGTQPRFWVPPVLHPSVGALLVTAPALYAEHLRRAFLDEEIGILHTQPRAWVPGNRVFQIRTGVYPQKTMLDINYTWDVLGVSETGSRFFGGFNLKLKGIRILSMEL